jgi:hypothetical protein
MGSVWLISAILGIVGVSAAACGRDVAVGDALRLESVTTGWVDAGPVGANNKLVPAVSFTVKNTTGRTLAPVQVNAVFRRVGDGSEWTNGLVVAADSRGLAPAAATDRLVIKGAVGYTGTDSQGDLLKNSHFVDATVDLFARYGSRQWARVAEYRVDRRIVER